jgi:hypothetical protein
MRWILPSVGDLLFVAILGVLIFTNLSVRLLGDAGIGWHIRTGQLILATHAIPRTDPFSSSMSGHPWFAWEWLYDVLVGWLESLAGLNGVILLTALIIAAAFSWVYRLLLARGTNLLLALILVLIAASASMIHFLARPHVVSWLLTVAWFWILESSEEGSSWRLWSLPLLMVVWVNVHGGFLLGFALLAIYWVTAGWQWLTLTLRLTEEGFDDFLRKLRTCRRFRVLTIVGILSAAATLLNPYGLQLHVHIYRYLSNRFLMDHIDEFQSPNFHYVAQKCFAGLLLLTLVALAAKGREFRRVSASHGLVVLFAVYSGLYASRNIPVSSLLLILVMGPWLSDAIALLAESRRTSKQTSMTMASTGFLRRMEVIESGLQGHVWPVVAIALTSWIVMHGGNLGGRQLIDAHFDSKRFPVAAVSYLEKQDVEGPVLSPDSWGGYLIYRLYLYPIQPRPTEPRMKVVIDDRHDLYGEEFLKSYLKMIHVQPGWDEFLEQPQTQCVLVPKDSALASILLETSEWTAIYGDDVAEAFIRTAAPLSH